MFITKTKTVYRAINPGVEDNPRLEALGWKWFKPTMEWRTMTQRRVLPVRQYADETCRQELEEAHNVFAGSLSDSHTIDAPEGFEVPAPDGLTYRPYQLAGIKYAHDHPDCLIGDDMRLGKTVQALGLCNLVGARTILVVPPATLKINWAREMCKWLLQPLDISICDGKKRAPKADAYICNYDILHHHIDFFRSVEWDVIIFDESHKLRGKDSRRTRLSLGNGGKQKPIPAKRRLFLSGTQLYTRPRDLWTMCMACDEDGLGKNWFSFVHKYCNAYTDSFGRLNTDGAKNEKELQATMRQRFMIRRTRDQVSKELPATLQVIPLDRKGSEALLKKEKKIASANKGRLDKLVGDLADLDVLNDWLADIDDTEADFIEEAGHYATVRRELGVKKIEKIKNFVDEVLENEEKVVVFAYHREVVEELAKKYPGSAKVIGGMSAQKKQEAVDRFTEEADCRVFVGNMAAAGEGISLAAANVAVFGEVSGIAAEMDQAERRIALLEKTGQDTIYYLVNEGSLDEKLVQTLKERRETFRDAMNIERIT